MGEVKRENASHQVDYNMVSVKCHFYSFNLIYPLWFGVANVFFPRRHLFEGKTSWEMLVGIFI